MNKETLKKAIEEKLFRLQDWTINYSKNAQGDLLAISEMGLERQLERIKEQMERLEALRKDTLEGIIGLVEMLNEKK
ncbi:MAG: hypothetical protein PHS54_05165 [Clostridia bacterium]|nr:hypothetical protein [Clostridia bacterium]